MSWEYAPQETPAGSFSKIVVPSNPFPSINSVGVKFTLRLSEVPASE